MVSCNSLLVIISCASLYLKICSGSVEDRLQMVFDMCDRNQEGRVERIEFCGFMRSANFAFWIDFFSVCVIAAYLKRCWLSNKLNVEIWA